MSQLSIEEDMDLATSNEPTSGSYDTTTPTGMELRGASMHPVTHTPQAAQSMKKRKLELDTIVQCKERKDAIDEELRIIDSDPHR
jgi:hypothetical protein